MQARTSKFEFFLIVSLSAALLAVWLSACITDINFPPMARTVHLLTAACLALLAWLEIRRPWLGFKLLFIGWTQGLVLREILAHHIWQAFANIPVFWGGPAAAALTVAYLLRTRTDALTHVKISETVEAPPNPNPWPWIRIMRWSLWVLVAFWIASTVSGSILLMNPPQGWHVGYGWRLFLIPGISIWTPLQSTVAIVPPLLLGLGLLHGQSLSRARVDPKISSQLLLFACIGFSIAGVELLLGRYAKLIFSFDELTPPSGPFANRNETGPVCVLAALLAAHLAIRSRGPNFASMGLKLIWAGVCAASILAVYQSLSRNAYMLLGIAACLLFMRRPSALKTAALVAGLGTCAALIMWAPAPNAELTHTYPGLARVLATVRGIRGDQSVNLFSDRLNVWETAWRIFHRYPLLGSGPGTFQMLGFPDSPFGAGLPDVFLAAHSMPLNILAECGPFAAVAWCMVWLMMPIAELAKRRANAWTVVSLLIGLANILDTGWLCPGMTTFACCAAAFSAVLPDNNFTSSP
jgi:hypothetical protein